MPQPTKKNNPPLAEQGVIKMLYIFLQPNLREITLENPKKLIIAVREAGKYGILRWEISK